MVTWREWPSGDAAQGWDASLLLATDQSVFQSYRWGEYKRQDGWMPLRFVTRSNEGSPVAMAQVLVKQYALGICICWVPGGPVLGFNKGVLRLSETIAGLLETLQKRFKHLYVRLQPCIERSTKLSYDMARAGLRQPPLRLSGGYTVAFHLEDTSPSELLGKMTAKHRYYVKQSRAAGLTWDIAQGPGTIATLVALNLDVARRTQVGWMATSEQKVQEMCSAMQGQNLILIGRLGTLAVCACLVLLSGSRAFYMIAGTSDVGRTSSASYAMFEELIGALSARGVADLDFGGIDPANSGAQGVNHYKLGFGGRVVEYLGEWEWASKPLLRVAVNFAVSRTMRKS